MLSRKVDENKIKQIKQALEGGGKAVIVCHSSPDGDAMGSSLALWHVLGLLGLEAVVITPDMPVSNLSCLPGFVDAVDATRYPDFAAKLIDDAATIFCLDFNEPNRVDKLADRITAATAFKVLIDHHENPAQFADVTISHPEMSSTCYLLFRVLCRLELFNFIDRRAAECLLAGMMTDTGNFSYNSADPEIYIVVAELMRKGADKDRLHRLLFDTFSANCLRLNGYALSEKMRVYDDRHAALITLTRAELNRYHYVKGDTEGLVNRPLAIPGVVYSCFLREESDYVKVSMRSVGDFPVNLLCSEHFGGGGHLNAAGGEFRGKLSEAVELFESLLDQNMKYIKTDNKRS